MARLHRLLDRAPKDVEALSSCAALLADSGKLDESLEMYNHAIDAWYDEGPGANDPPVLLLKARRQVRNRLLAQQR